MALPADPQVRTAIVRVLADAGLLTRAYVRAGLAPPPFATDRLALKASYLATMPAGVVDFRVMDALTR